MFMRCLECFASNAYSCFSKASLTAMAVVKVLATISIIVIVAVKLEDVRVEVQLPPDITTAAGLANLTASLIAGSAPAAAVPPPPLPAGGFPSPYGSGSGSDTDVDLDAMAGLFHVNASCLLQKRGLNGQFPYNRTMCSYVYAVCGISLLATFAMACLLWCTCHLCGWGPMLELSFALLGTAWWLAAALVLQENTMVAVDAKPVAWQMILNGAAASPPPPVDPAALLLPPPPSPPRAPVGDDTVSRLAVLLEEYTPKSLQQWRQALLGLSWAMMGMFAACSVLLLVEACGCLLDCCSCVCRCCCCPDRPESRWRANLRKRKRMAGEEYMEMRGGIAPSASLGGSPSGGGAPAVMVVARSDDYSGASSPADPRVNSGRGWW